MKNIKFLSIFLFINLLFTYRAEASFEGDLYDIVKETTKRCNFTPPRLSYYCLENVKDVKEYPLLERKIIEWDKEYHSNYHSIVSGLVDEKQKIVYIILINIPTDKKESFVMLFNDRMETSKIKQVEGGFPYYNEQTIINLHRAYSEYIVKQRKQQEEKDFWQIRER